MSILYVSEATFGDRSLVGGREYTVTPELMLLGQDYGRLLVGEDNDLAGVLADKLEEEADAAGADWLYWSVIDYLRNAFLERGPVRSAFGCFTTVRRSKEEPRSG